MQGMHLTLLSRQCVLLEPKVNLNPANPESYADEIICFLQKNHTRGLIYDLKNIALIDKIYYRWLKYLSTLCRLNNTQLVTVNIRPSAAYGLSSFINGPPPFLTALDIESARTNLMQKIT